MKSNIIKIYGKHIEKNIIEYIGNGIAINKNGMFLSARHILYDKDYSDFFYSTIFDNKQCEIINYSEFLIESLNNDYFQDILVGQIDSNNNFDKLNIQNSKVKSTDKFSIIGFYDNGKSLPQSGIFYLIALGCYSIEVENTSMRQRIIEIRFAGFYFVHKFISWNIKTIQYFKIT